MIPPSYLSPFLGLLETLWVLFHPRAFALTVSPAENNLSQAPSHPSNQSSYGTSEKSLPLPFFPKHHQPHALRFLTVLASYANLQLLSLLACSFVHASLEHTQMNLVTGTVFRALFL